ncbi:hypothetical protein YC2023_116000 [Brassica napus]
MKLDGVYYPLNDSISWLTTCMEEMRQDIARIQRANDVIIDRCSHLDIDRQRSAQKTRLVTADLEPKSSPIYLRERRQHLIRR